jgi:hypothetical protein
LNLFLVQVKTMSITNILIMVVLLFAMLYIGASYGNSICKILTFCGFSSVGGKVAKAALPPVHRSSAEKFLDDELENTESLDLEDVSVVMRKRINSVVGRVAGAPHGHSLVNNLIPHQECSRSRRANDTAAPSILSDLLVSSVQPTTRPQATCTRVYDDCETFKLSGERNGKK